MTFRQPAEQFPGEVCPNCGRRDCGVPSTVEAYNKTVNGGWGTSDTNDRFQAMSEAKKECHRYRMETDPVYAEKRRRAVLR